MLEKIIHKVARRHHFWRDVSFSELAEIYASMSLRSFGFGIIGVFVPVFLYKNEVDLRGIFLFYTLFFLLRIPIAYVAGFIVGRIGPKHTIAVSILLLVSFLMQLLTYPSFQWPLALLAFSFTLANGVFFIAYHTDFSKIKSIKHGGKELGWLFIFEKAGTAIGPFIGGLLATFISPLLTIGFAILVLLSSLIPLFLSSEPVKVHQHITYKGFHFRRHARNYFALGMFGIENVATMVMWPLLIAVLIFSDDTYAKVGSIIAVATVLSMFGARMFGRIVDDNKGYYLVRYGVIFNAITHCLRSFITTAAGAITISFVNEPTTLAYKMPIIKGFYDSSDSEEGYRIVYLVVAEITSAVSKALYCFALFAGTYFYDSISVLRVSFFIVGLVSLLILTQRFPALKKV